MFSLDGRVAIVTGGRDLYCASISLGLCEMGAFPELEYAIRKATENLDIPVISGLCMVPHDENIFADLFVHPNDTGFEHFYKNLYNEIIKER